MQLARKKSAFQWQPLALVGGLFAVLGLALYWRLGSLLPGYSSAELNTFQTDLSPSGLLEHPLNAPFLLVLKALLYIDSDSLLMTRIAATLFGLAVLGLFYWLIRQWHDDRTAAISTLLFGLSAWFLHTARMGTPDILMSGVFILAACGFWLKQSKSWPALLACFALAALFLYVPGMVWFIVAGIAWEWKTIDRIFKRHLPVVSAGGLLLVAALVPLGWAIYKDPGLLTSWLGLPSDWPNPLEVIGNVLAVPYHLIVANTSNPEVWLGRAPILDVFSTAMLLIGGYLYVQNARLVRAPLFASVLGIGIVLIGLGGAVTAGVFMPFVYVVIAAGISYMIGQWFRVFPRNPIARSIGIGLVAIVIGLAIAYHLQHYFIGWPEAQATHDVYTITQP